MKIYPGNHSIELSEETAVGNIPLSYLLEADKDISAEINIEPDFARNGFISKIYPYQTFGTDNVLLFDENEKAISDAGKYLRRSGNKYYFELLGSTEFIPEEFTYSLLMQRNDVFKNIIKYNLKIACYDEELAQAMIGYFNDENANKPNNIIVNDHGIYAESLYNMSFDKLDLFFVKKSQLADDVIDYCMENHINVWIFDDTEINFRKECSEYIAEQLSSNNIYTKLDSDQQAEIVNRTAYYGASVEEAWQLYMSSTETFTNSVTETSTIEDLLSKLIQNFVIQYIINNGIYTSVTCFVENNDIDEYILSENSIYKTNEYELNGYHYVEADLINLQNQYANYEVINLFDQECPIALLKKDDKAFIAISHSSMIDAMESCSNLMFEIIMKIYLAGYFSTETRTQYIADNKIDYYIKLNRIYGWYHPGINLPSIFVKDGFNTDIAYDICNIEIDRDDIQYVGQDKHNNILFQKTSTSDPTKENNMLSIYTVNNTIIYYAPNNNVIFSIEDQLKLSYQVIDDENYLVIEPFRSSANVVNLTYQQKILIKDTSRYILCYDHTLDMFILIDEVTYTEAKYGTKYASIKLSYNTQITCGDIRIYGGGEIDASENYEMIDTGYLYGRPYRVGSSMVIKLPKTLASYESIIKTEITKHISSGDYPFLVFE